MKAPLCPKCETHHWSTQRCPADGRVVRPAALPPDSVTLETAVKAVKEHRLDPAAVIAAKPDKLFMPAFSSDEDVENAKKLVSVLTPAERQKRYREKMGDEGRKRDRERKAGKKDV